MTNIERIEICNEELRECINLAENLPNLNEASIETCRIVLIHRQLAGPSYVSFTALDEGQLITEVIENPFYWSDVYNGEAVIIEAVKNTMIIFSDGYQCAFTSGGDVLLLSEQMNSELGFPTYGIMVTEDDTVYIDYPY